jgi:serine/threonine protein kinase/Tol biopolymer transport system component
MPLSVGMRLGPYEIISSIGAGGMCEVYRARDTRLDRTVAIKVLLEHRSNSPQVRERFEREARAISSLSHPHICALYDIGQQDAVDYLVMEYLEGETLAHRLKKGPVPIHQVLRYAIEIADALETAHRHGVIHRDLKPGNVMLTKSGAKLLDFGLAKVRSAETVTGVTSLATQTATLTSEGTILGTLQYMAPEQLEGKEADARTDIFALGAVIYEMVTGRKAFEGKSHASLIAAILEREPTPIATLQNMAPAALDHVVRTSMAKDPGARWQAAHDVLVELKWILESGSQAGIPKPLVARRKSTELLLSGLLAVVSITLVVLALVHFREQPPPQELARVSVLLPEKARALSLAVSPDGREIAVVLVREGKQQIWVRALDALEPTVLAGTDGAVDPFWSPDNRSIAFFADAKLKKVDRSGGPVQTVCDALGARGGTWNRNGEILFGGLGRVQRVPAAGGVVSDLPKHAAVTEIYPFFLPDGQHYLATRDVNASSTQGSVWLSSMDGPVTRQILPDSSNAEIMEPPPGSQVGDVLFTRGATLMALPFDMRRLEAAGEPFPVAQRIAAGLNPYWLTATSSQGLLAYVSGQSGGWQYVWRDRQGRKLGVAGEPSDYNSVSISPDGQRLVGDNGEDTWLLEFARGVATRLTFEHDFNPIWSPDGRYVAYAKEGVGIFRKPANGAGDEELLVRWRGLAFPKSWSPDGQFMVYAQLNSGTGADLLAIPVNGDRKPFGVVQTPATEDQGQFSPDGHWLAYTSNGSGQSEIYVIPFPPSAGGGKWLVSRGGGVQARWHRNGRELFYISPDSKMMSVEVNTRLCSTPALRILCSCAWRIHKITLQSASGTTRDSASASL